MEHSVTTDGDCVVIALHGDIDLQYSTAARDVMLQAVGDLQATDEVLAVFVDMSGVGMIDSSGVASLLEALQETRKRGKRFILCAVDPSVDRVLRLARLETVFEIADTAEAARQSLTE